MDRRTKILTTAFAGAVLTAGMGVGVAVADPQNPTPSSSASPKAAPSHQADKKGGKATPKKHRALQARALHGEAVLGKKSFRVVTFQRGTVEKISATSLTVKSVDGFTATYALDDKTTVYKAKEKTKISDVHIADKVRIRGIKDANTTTAKAIHERRNR